MFDYSNLTDAEINAKLAEKMGWSVTAEQIRGGLYVSFSPCTSRDDLAVVVGEMTDDQCDALQDGLWLREEYKPLRDFMRFTLTCPPRIIAEACLEVLEG